MNENVENYLEKLLKNKNFQTENIPTEATVEVEEEIKLQSEENNLKRKLVSFPEIEKKKNFVETDFSEAQKILNPLNWFL